MNNIDILLEQIGSMSDEELQAQIDALNEKKGRRPLSMILFEYKRKQNPIVKIKPDYDFKDNILKQCQYLMDLHKILHQLNQLLVFYMTCSSYSVLFDSDNIPYGLKFDFLNRESKKLEGEYWIYLFCDLQEDFKNHYGLDFTRKNVRICNNLYKTTFEFLCDFSSIKEDIHKWCNLVLNSGNGYKDKTTYEYFKECERIYESLRKKRYRILKKIRKLLSSPCLWLTFTFNNRTLERTTEDTRRRKVRRLLTDFNAHYIGNIDYGEKNEREHYHVILQCDNIDMKLLAKKYKKYGSIKVMRIGNTENDCKRLTNYINKLTNHALKTTKQKTRLLYDRI